MHYYEIIESIVELYLFYSILLLIDPKNKISAVKLIILFTVLTILLVVINLFDLSYYMGATSVVCAVGFWIILRRNIFQFAPDLFLSICFVSLLQLGISHIPVYFIGNDALQAFIRVLMYIALIALFSILSYKKILEVFLSEYYRPNKAIFILPLALIILIFIVLSSAKEKDFAVFINNIEIVTIIILVFTVFILLYAKSRIKETMHKKNSDRMFGYGDHQAEVIDGLMEKIHDMNNGLQDIHRITNNSKDPENQNELIQCLDSFENKNVNVSTIGANTKLAAFLYDRQQVAEMFGVNLNYSLTQKYEYDIPEYDLERMLRNLINNAIEYEVGLKSLTIKKYVNVEFKKTTIIVSNPVENTITSDSIKEFRTRGFTTKKDDDGKEHGIGLSSVENLAKKTGTLFEPDVNDGVFTACISIK